jgi:hypothetical protein
MKIDLVGKFFGSILDNFIPQNFKVVFEDNYAHILARIEPKNFLFGKKLVRIECYQE